MSEQLLKITCCTADGRQAEIELHPSSTFGDMKNILSAEFSADPETLTLSYRGDTSIPDSETVANQGLQNHDMLLVIIQRRYSLPPPAATATPRPLNNPPAIFPPALQGLAQLLQPPSQAVLEERRQRQEAIDANMQLAMEESPESFAAVYMLYIDVEINGVPVKAFVDSGAQTTVMSRRCAERTGVIGLVDPRFSGVAVGVGSARILGRVHLAPVKIGAQFYNCSFAVLDASQNLDLLIGLDMLKKYQCNIDMKNDRLVIGTTGQTVAFLPESQLPAHARLH